MTTREAVTVFAGSLLAVFLAGIGFSALKRSLLGNQRRETIIKDTHRGLWYEDGVLKRELGAGRYVVPYHVNFGFFRTPKVEIVVVDVRERDLTIKGQEILTADKVAIRVSIIVQFKVIDPRAVLHVVDNYEDRIYSDVQLAARRALASMTLEDILTNRNRLSEEILADMKETAIAYGVAILRADVKDLIFPGNLQEIMNKVLAAERMSQAQLVEARTNAEVREIDAAVRAHTQRVEAEASAAARRTEAEGEAEALRIKTDAELEALEELAKAAQAYSVHPPLLRLRELDTLRELGKGANARIYVGFDSANGHGKPKVMLEE